MNAPVVEREVEIVNQAGLHARPAALFVNLAGKYGAEIIVEKDGLTVNGKSILNVMMLAAECGSRLTLRAEGADAREAIDALAQLIESGFQEE